MKRLLPVVLLAGVILGLIVYRSETRPPAGAAATPPPAPTVLPSVSPAASSLPATASALRPRLAPPEPAAALTDEISRALRQGSAAERDRAFHDLLPRLIARDPAAAGHLALAWEPGALRDEFLHHVIRLWSAADIGGTVTWLISLLDAPDRATAARAATAQVAQSDPAGALELSQLLRTGLDDGSLEHLAQLWTEEKPDAAMQWVETRPAGAMRDRLVARIAHVRAQQEPAEAARLVLALMPAGPAQDAAVLTVVRQWAARDPAGAAAWVTQFPAGPLQTRARAELR